MKTTPDLRRDEALKADIAAELRLETFLRPERMGVEVVDGRVTLTGCVESFAEKTAADLAARYAAGRTAQIVGVSIKRFDGPRRAAAAPEEMRVSMEHDQNNIRRTALP